ncbi:glutathione S-transferase family protein [Alteromonas sp. ASW11-36]|uniref:Glutathione S-transferase family protein n=1 Tax=Alteromonas arenosi TaxID=3055817 RepID=A0ABT7SSN8_9ALTE|nr:glutathione S-transferase family protein [Alteromonas sp. ASW11-36]MDM7858994.1 glutathione S-transferase family protein [Alteromonas sp. ASW11-36]
MISIYSFPGTRGVRVTWAAEELGTAYEYKIINLYQGEHKQPEYLAISPTAKVPVIKDGNTVIAESGAILTYLADCAGKLIPPTATPERACYEQMMYFVMTELEQPLWTMGKHKFALPEVKRIAANLELGAWEFQQALAIFAQLLGDRQYVLGDEFSVADIAAGHTLSWAQGFKQPLTHDNVIAYADRVLARPALAKAREVEAQAKASLA